MRHHGNYEEKKVFKHYNYEILFRSSLALETSMF
jgi:hypothetical protein